MEQFIADLASNYPILVTVLSVIGVLRIINKPLFSVLHAYVAATDTKSDDALLESVETSKVNKVIQYVLDWTASIKLPPKKA